MSQPKAYLEHVAFWVRDIQWHIRFFSEVCGMTMREIQGDVEQPAQYWTLGGLQFIHQPDFAGPEGRMAHLGIMCEDLEAALAAIVRLAMERLRDDTPPSSGSSDGLPNVRGLLAFGLRRQLAAATDPAVKASLQLRLADLLEDSIDKRELAEALALYREALTHDPESPTAIAGVRRVAVNLGDLSAQLYGELRAAEIVLDKGKRVEHLLRAAELSPRVPAPEGGEGVALDRPLKIS